MKTAPARTYLSSADLERLAGVSYRQVDYWVRIGLLRTASPVEGSGTRRRFHPRELDVARAVAALRALGVGEGNGGYGTEVVRAVADAVRVGRKGVKVGAWWVALEGERVTLWTDYGGNGERHP